MGLTKQTWQMPRRDTARLVAATSEKGQWVALRILDEERKWIKTRQICLLKKREQGSIPSRLDSEEPKLAIGEYIAGAGDSITSLRLASAITTYWTTGKLANRTDLQEGNIAGSQDTSSLASRIEGQADLRTNVQTVLKSRTAAEWLHKLWYKYKEVKKGVYQDGHEREDVVAYRQGEFLPALDHLKPYMVKWELDIDGNPSVIFPENLPAGQRPIALVTHDESTFDSNEGRGYSWMKEGQRPLRKRSRGKGIMISDFVTAGGRLQAPSWLDIEDLPSVGLSDDLNLRYSPYSATMKVEYGGDQGWKGDDLVNQVVQVAVPIVSWAFPGCQAVFLFNNATSHSAFASDALHAKSMSLRQGGAQNKLRPGINPLTLQPQPMVDELGITKGLKRVLEERGLWRRGLPLQCFKPGTNKRRKTWLQGGICCARALIANQEDFKNQKCKLPEEVELKDHLVLFDPKFPCEINFIEYVGGAAKRYTRNNCGYSIKALRKLIPEALESVSAQQIWKYANKVDRIMNAYRD